MSFVATALQLVGIVAVVVAVGLLATMAWTVLAAGLAAVLVGLALEQGDDR